MNGLDASTKSGLSEKEVAERLQAEGYNELPAAAQRGVMSIVWDIVCEPMFLLLVACGVIYLVLGDLQDALMLLGFVFIIMGITFYQERKTERALEALRDLSSPRALVIRDGKQVRIPGREVVRGDIVLLSEGDRVPADAAVLECVNLSVDESLLTGESAPVHKVMYNGANSIEDIGTPGGDGLPFVYSGTLVVCGQGLAQIYATGIRTEIGKIGTALQTVESERTLLQKETDRLTRNLAIGGLSLCTIVVIVYGLTAGNWLSSLLAGITLAMSMLPEELPVVLTIFLSLGAWRISQKRVLTRRTPVIEALGSATVLCVDKTGTLTTNRMSIAKIFAAGRFHSVACDTGEQLPEMFYDVVKFGILASKENPVDPMEKAFKQFDSGKGCGKWSFACEYPLSPALLAVSHVWKSPYCDEYLIAAKGAPEAIADLCHFDAVKRAELSKVVSAMAEEGLRVLGVAKAFYEGAVLPAEQSEFAFEFLGLVGLADPVRQNVPEAVKECHDAGIKVAMITGDYPGTAQSIARQIGLRNPDEVITGSELREMSDEELCRRIKSVNVFARIIPEQKLRLVNAFKANGEIAVMTGDGVNDAPALKAAHVGIAMGGRGTDVAREAASLVLLDDDFSSIVQAIKMGRRIFDNIRKAIAYTMAIHVPIAGMSLIPVLFKWPMVFLPVHIVFLELIIDPACSIVFEAEAEESGLMVRPPRDSKKPLFSWRTIGLSLLQGVSVLLVVLAVFCIANYRGLGEAETRTLTFTTLVIANLGLIFTNRSWSRVIVATLHQSNAALWWVTGGTVLLLGVVLYLPGLRELFHFAVLHPLDLLVCLGAGAVSIVWFEVVKVIRGRQLLRIPNFKIKK